MKIAKLNSRNRRKIISPAAPPNVRLNLGSGPNKMPGFLSVDQIAFPGVDVVADLNGQWPWEDNSIEEVFSSHCIEHFDAVQRVHFVNELYRVLKPRPNGTTPEIKTGQATIIAPHWSSCRAYGDPTHEWPPVSEFWFFYLSEAWRMQNAPHTDIRNWSGGFSCNFAVQWGYSLDADTAARNQEYAQYAMGHYINCCQDIQATFTKG